jgi:small-conductance mechanosensitive channel
MSLPPVFPDAAKKLRDRIFRRTRDTLLLVLSALLILCLIFVWTTRDALTHFSFLPGRGPLRAATGAKKTVIDLSPWQTAQTLAALAVSAEEAQYAREAEHLADHEVDQAFAAALRQATIQAQHRNLTGDALALSKKVDQLQQLVNQDLAAVSRLTPPDGGKGSNPSSDDTDIEIAKAQLQLDSDELDDAQDDLARASGDQRAQIQSELTAHEATMKKYDSESHMDGQIAVLSVGRYGTLIGRLGAWNRQRTRQSLLEQAIQQTQNDIRMLTDQHNSLEAQLKATGPVGSVASDRTAKLAAIKEGSSERQLLTIYDDRIQTEQQLVTVYSKWSAQVLRQHRIVGHLILQSCAWVLVILILMVLGDALVRRLMAHPALERRQAQTLRMLLVVAVQLTGALLILLFLFGAPHETPTILGLTTAALTFALQDFVLAFFGWFVLMGKRGIRIGDWVEINGVSGEVIEVGLMRSTLLETGNLAERGTPTGRRISFMNSFAIRGQYFNFSTSGQWMWDEISVAVPASLDTTATMERILSAVQEETKENAGLAEQEWTRGAHGHSLATFRTDPAVNLRPSGSGVDVEVRYVTRASERFEMRNRLYRRVLNVLREPASEPMPIPAS